MVTVVIGADKGIGRSIVRALATRGEADVVAVCLGAGADLAGEASLVVPDTDVTSTPAVARMAETIAARHKRVDVLFHVSGILSQDTLGEIDFEQCKREFDINTIGPMRTVQALLPLLQEGAKVGILTSRVGSLTDNSSGGLYAYRVSKAGANMVALNLHLDLSKRGVAVVALHPGMVATDLTKDYPRGPHFATPDEAATGLIARMDALTLAGAGQFLHANGERLPW